MRNPPSISPKVCKPSQLGCSNSHISSVCVSASAHTLSAANTKYSAWGRNVFFWRWLLFSLLFLRSHLIRNFSKFAFEIGFECCWRCDVPVYYCSVWCWDSSFEWQWHTFGMRKRWHSRGELFIFLAHESSFQSQLVVFLQIAIVLKSLNFHNTFSWNCVFLQTYLARYSLNSFLILEDYYSLLNLLFPFLPFLLTTYLF